MQIAIPSFGLELGDPIMSCSNHDLSSFDVAILAKQMDVINNRVSMLMTLKVANSTSPFFDRQLAHSAPLAFCFALCSITHQLY